MNFATFADIVILVGAFFAAILTIYNFFFKAGKGFFHAPPRGRCSIQEPTFIGFLRIGALFAAGFPLLAFKSMAAIGRVHEFGMEGNNGFDPLFFQPANQPINIYEISVDALQVHHIRLFLPDDLLQAQCRPQASTIGHAGHTGK